MSGQGGVGARATITRLGERTRKLPDEAKGVIIVCAGVLALTPDALLIRLMTVDEGTMLMLRGAFAVVGYLLLIQILAADAARRVGSQAELPSAARLEAGAGGYAVQESEGGAGSRAAPPSGARRERRAELAGALRLEGWALTRPELVVAGLISVTNVCFVTSIVHTNAALALVIVSSAPAFTTVFSRFFGGELVAARTWVASWMVLAGVAAIFLTEPQGGELIGALAAVAASAILAATLVVRRAHPVRMLRSLALGALLTAIVATPFADLGSISGSDLAIAAVTGLVVLPVSMELIWRGPRYISAPEVSLILLLEAILGPAWVWAALGEAPTLQAVLAGALILGTLAVHSLLAQRALRAGQALAAQTTGKP